MTLATCLIIYHKSANPLFSCFNARLGSLYQPVTFEKDRAFQNYQLYSNFDSTFLCFRSTPHRYTFSFVKTVLPIFKNCQYYQFPEDDISFHPIIYTWPFWPTTICLPACFCCLELHLTGQLHK